MNIIKLTPNKPTALASLMIIKEFCKLQNGCVGCPIFTSNASCGLRDKPPGDWDIITDEEYIFT